MASISITELVSSSTPLPLSLSSNGSIFINTAGFSGFGFDINLSSTSATGTLYIYSQYTNPIGDIFVSSIPTGSNALSISNGNFGSGVTRQTVDNNNVSTAGWIILKWVGSDSSSGHINIVGNANIF